MGTIGVAMSWECVCSSEAPAGIAVVLEDHDVLEPRVLREVADPVPVGAEHLREMRRRAAAR